MRKFRDLPTEKKLIRLLLLLFVTALACYILFSFAWGVYLIRTVRPVCAAVGAAQYPCGTYAAYAALHCTERFQEREDALPEYTENGLRYQVKLPHFGSFSYTLAVSQDPATPLQDAQIHSDAYEITCPLFSGNTYTYSCMILTEQTNTVRKSVNHRFQLDAQQRYCSGQSPDSSFTPQDEEALFRQQNTRSAELYQALRARFGIQ